jgi:hypothetical protein
VLWVQVPPGQLEVVVANDATDALLERMVLDCETAVTASNHPFTDWEKEFIASAVNQYKARRWLSAKQIEAVKKCWDKI